MKRALLLAAIALLIAAGSGFAQAAPAAPAQQAQQPPPTWDQVALRSFTGVYDKLIDMAKDFPEDKFDYKPHPDSRSFVEELQHALGPIQGQVARMKGEQPDRAASQIRDRAALVAALEKAKTEYVELWAKEKNPSIIRWAEHAGEHYGKLVTMYRVNGRVPPATANRGQ